MCKCVCKCCGMWWLRRLRTRHSLARQSGYKVVPTLENTCTRHQSMTCANAFLQVFARVTTCFFVAKTLSCTHSPLPLASALAQSSKTQPVSTDLIFLCDMFARSVLAYSCLLVARNATQHRIFCICYYTCSLSLALLCLTVNRFLPVHERRHEGEERPR